MYTILPFHFTKIDNEVLLINECGLFTFLNEKVFKDFIQHNLDINDNNFLDLESNLFATSGNVDLAIRKIAARYRSRKEFLREFTSLHMMVITVRCNQRCKYCQASSVDENNSNYDMPIHIAEKIVDYIFTTPTQFPKIEFQGGEPLLNWPVITATVEKAELLALKQGKSVDFVICTNLFSITDNQLNYCKKHNIKISTSLDGPQYLHDTCRLTRFGQNTYDIVIKNINKARNILGKDNISALMTTTSFSVNHLKEVVDEYIKNDMDGIFIRALNPYGFATIQSNILNYNINMFIENYIETINYIIELNRKIYFPEYFATLLFTRMLTFYSTGFVDLQSPSGAGISGIIYDFDGSVFLADEARMLARMGDRHFYLGNVNTDSWETIFYGEKLKNLTKASCVETTIPCAWCAFQTYCGTDPIRNYLETGKEHRNMTNSIFCIKNKTIFKHLFYILKNADNTIKDIIWSWITHNPEIVHRENYKR